MLELNYTPFPELKTERLLLRRLTTDDARDMFALRSNPDVMRYLGREPAQSIKEVENFINAINKSIDENENILWGITILSNTTKIIGTICLWNFKKENFRGEIGYMLHPDHWGKGLMKEAINCVVDYGFTILKLHSIEALLDPVNVASSAVLGKTGFVKEGHLKESFYFNGKFSDSAIYSRLK